MGSLGRKIDKVDAINEFNKFKELLLPKHCEYGVDNITLSGSLRRGKEYEIGDIDIIITTLDGKIPHMLTPMLKSSGYIIDASGENLIRMLTSDNIQLDIYSCTENQFPMMLAYLTGPGEYNIQMRAVAKRKGFKLNQVSLMKGDGIVEVNSEKHLFHILGCEYIEPQDRINFYDSVNYHKYKKGDA